MGNEFRLAYYYIELALRRPAIWIAPALLLFALGTYYVVNLPRSYYAEAVIVVGSQAIPSSLVQSTVANERLQFIEQRVLARENLLKLVDKFDLLTELKGQVSKTELAQIFRSQIVISLRASEASEQYAASSVFGIGVDASTPELAADIAGEIVAMITEENRRARMWRATEASAFLEREVKVLKSRVGELDARLAEFVRVNENALPTRISLHLGDIREGQSELTEIGQSVAEARSNVELLRAELALTTSSENTTAIAQQDELRTLKSTLVARSSVLSPQHHEIKSLKARIAALEIGMAADDEGAVTQIAQTPPSPERQLIEQRIELAERQVAAFERREAELTRSISEIRQIVSDMPNVEAELTLLTSERDAAQTNLDDMSGRLNVARLGERLETDQQDEQIQVLEAPEAPLYPSGATRTEYMLAVLGASLALGLGCLLAADTFDPKIRGAFDIAAAASGSAIVIVDDWKTPAQQRRTMIVAAAALLALAAGVAALFLYPDWPPGSDARTVFDHIAQTLSASIGLPAGEQ